MFFAGNPSFGANYFYGCLAWISGGNWNAQSTSMHAWGHSGDKLRLYFNSGLTPFSAFTPTETVTIDATDFAMTQRLKSTSASIGTGAPSTRHVEIYKSESAYGLVNITNAASDGFSSIYFNNTAGAYQGSIGFGNSGVGSAYASKLFVDCGVDFSFVSGGSTVGLNIAATTGEVRTGAAVQKKVADITSNTTLSAAHHHVFVDATSGNLTITLPALSAAVTSGSGREYIIHRVDGTANTVTVDGNGSETINGLASIDINTQYSVLRVIARSTGTGWYTF